MRQAHAMAGRHDGCGASGAAWFSRFVIVSSYLIGFACFIGDASAQNIFSSTPLAATAPAPASAGPGTAGSLPRESAMPVISGMRLMGDDKQTRFVIDLDRKIDIRAFTLADPYRVVIDIPQVVFQLPAMTGQTGRGLVKTFRYGLVMQGGSRIVMDLIQPARIDKTEFVAAANGQPARLIIELDVTDRAAFMRELALRDRSAERAPAAPASAAAGSDKDTRPVVVLDPGHGGLDNGTRAASGENEKDIVFDFAQSLRSKLEESGKYRVVMTRADDTFIPLADRVKIAREQKAALFISIHADALPRSEGDAQGATVYTLSETASEAEAARLAEAENKADAIAGIDLSEEPTEVADILIDLVQRETKAFSHRFAHTLVTDLKNTARLHKKPLKSAGFRVLKAQDVPSVLVELGYVSNRADLKLLTSDSWRTKTVAAMAHAVDTFFARKLAGEAAGLRR